MKKYGNHLVALCSFACFLIASIYFGGIGGCALTDNDNDAPALTATVPANVDTSVAINTKIAAAFDEDIDAGSITADHFTVVGPDALPIAGTVAVDGANRIAIFTPSADLETDTLYTATLTTDVQDSAGNNLATAYVWAFTTGSVTDAATPLILSTEPADVDVNVDRDQTVSVTFDETMNPLTVDENHFLVIDADSNAVGGSVDYNLLTNTATFRPDAKLDSESTYSATITADVQDLAGNSLASDYSWSFTTGTL